MDEIQWNKLSKKQRYNILLDIGYVENEVFESVGDWDSLHVMVKDSLRKFREKLPSEIKEDISEKKPISETKEDTNIAEIVGWVKISATEKSGIVYYEGNKIGFMSLNSLRRFQEGLIDALPIKAFVK